MVNCFKQRKERRDGLFLGLDLGTSALKGLVFDQTGELKEQQVLTIHCHP